MTTYATTCHQLLQQGRNLCVGFDPSTAMLQSWQLDDTVDSLNYFSMQLAQACIKHQVAFAKPQSAFYERHGWQGIKVLQQLTYHLRQAGIITIFDGKRGDIGSTASAYANAYLASDDFNKHPCMTVNPFLGVESLAPFIERIEQDDVGIFIIVRSSNPQAADMQQATAKYLANYIFTQNKRLSPNGIGPLGAVIGSTLDGLDDLLQQMPNALFLCPGIGAQGASVNDALQRLTGFREQCIFPISRGISLGGNSQPQLADKIKHFQDALLTP